MSRKNKISLAEDKENHISLRLIRSAALETHIQGALNYISMLRENGNCIEDLNSKRGWKSLCLLLRNYDWRCQKCNRSRSCLLERIHGYLIHSKERSLKVSWRPVCRLPVHRWALGWVARNLPFKCTKPILMFLFSSWMAYNMDSCCENRTVMKYEHFQSVNICIY